MKAAIARLRTLPCWLGLHKPAASGTWNGGYCFTSCSRCGRDMVRSLFGEWHVPVDFRIVWHAKSPIPIVEIAASTRGPIKQDAIPAPALAPAPAAVPAPKPRPDKADPRSPFDFDDFD